MILQAKSSDEPFTWYHEDKNGKTCIHQASQDRIRDGPLNQTKMPNESQTMTSPQAFDGAEAFTKQQEMAAIRQEMNRLSDNIQEFSNDPKWADYLRTVINFLESRISLLSSTNTRVQQAEEKTPFEEPDKMPKITDDSQNLELLEDEIDELEKSIANVQDPEAKEKFEEQINSAKQKVLNFKHAHRIGVATVRNGKISLDEHMMKAGVKTTHQASGDHIPRFGNAPVEVSYPASSFANTPKYQASRKGLRTGESFDEIFKGMGAK